MEEVRTALQSAASQGNIGEAEKILNIYEDFSIDDFLGYGVFCDNTLLTEAAKCGHIEFAFAMLQRGGDLYSRGIFNGVRFVKLADDYLGAMVNAAARGYMECVLMLAEFRFFPDYLDLHQTDPVYTKLVGAAKEGYYYHIEMLLDNVEDKSAVLKGWKGHNIMNMCLLRGCPSSFLKVIVGHGVDIQGWDINGLTPLMCAILGKNLECVQYLLHHGADVRTIELNFCRYFKDDGTVDYLHNPFIQDARTALVYATCVGDIPILEAVLQSVSPKDVNRPDGCDGRCPLSYAVMAGNKDAVVLLLENGANTDVQQYGPLCDAAKYGHTDLLHFFLDKSPSIGEVYEAAEECIFMNYVEYLDVLIKSCDGAICRGAYEGKLFDVAVCESSLACGKFLIETGLMRPDVAFNQGMTALICSVQNGRHEFVEYLIKYGVNLNATNVNGMSAIRCAVQRRSHPKCLQLLLDAGADVDIVDKQNMTIFCDVISGDETCLEKLLKNGLLLQDGKLKNVHKIGVKSMDKEIYFPLKNVLLLMRHNVFEWEWCLQAHNLNNIAFAAVTEGHCPGKCIHYKDERISLLHLVLIKKNADALLYLLANLYFLPDDFGILKSDLTKSVSDVPTSTDDHKRLIAVMDQLTSQPFGLQTWCFLVISKALSSNLACFNDRAVKVNALPLPRSLQKLLKFGSMFSHLCPSHWRRMGSEMNDNYCSLIMDKAMFRKPPLIKCSTDCDACFGLGEIFSKHDI